MQVCLALLCPPEVLLSGTRSPAARTGPRSLLRLLLESWLGMLPWSERGTMQSRMLQRLLWPGFIQTSKGLRAPVGPPESGDAHLTLPSPEHESRLGHFPSPSTCSRGRQRTPPLPGWPTAQNRGHPEFSEAIPRPCAHIPIGHHRRKERGRPDSEIMGVDPRSTGKACIR